MLTAFAFFYRYRAYVSANSYYSNLLSLKLTDDKMLALAIRNNDSIEWARAEAESSRAELHAQSAVVDSYGDAEEHLILFGLAAPPICAIAAAWVARGFVRAKNRG